ncbi:hypothetical protein MPSI1_002976 [Malassezia psittaci]|uniref:Uncharacterized protein n=1 Tax=Malassezia psittaci TaxID=1821823 RepID=A0AAF0JFE2_9BASI|nr:hypothetical protein MPSI1_002976 [Malassezia psittaci]
MARALPVMPAMPTARVVYRGGALNFSFFIRDYLSWPLFASDPDTKVELAPGYFRYPAAIGTILISTLCGWYFWYSPSRMITRITVYPRTNTVGLRTAAPSPALWLPKFVRSRPFFQRAGTVSETDPFERVVGLNDIYRLQGSAIGSQLAACNRLVKDRVELPTHLRSFMQRTAPSIPKIDTQEGLMLRVKDARLAFQLSAEPLRETLLNEPPKGGLSSLFRRFFKGPTDWKFTPGYLASPIEQEAHAVRMQGANDNEPWFLDRANFDQLFPLDNTRYKKK